MVSGKEAASKLDAFLVDNQELEELTSRLTAFNIFRVLQIEQMEIRHSNVLAWLLTPGETHGVGARFLRRFLSRLLMENEFEGISLTPAKVELMKFGNVEVLREWQNIDVLVRSCEDKWALLIENKIGSKEQKGQLSRYKQILEEDIPEGDIIPVFLTVEGDDPSEKGRDAGFVPLSHVQVLELLEKTVQQNSDRIPNDAAVFLTHYMNTLRRVTMQDKELTELCKTIYAKHKDAIELINEYGMTSAVMNAVGQYISEVIKPVDERSGMDHWFLPAELEACLPEVEIEGWSFLKKRVGICLRYNYCKADSKLKLVLEVGRIANRDTYRRLLEELKKNDIGKAGKAKMSSGTSRVLTFDKPLRKNEYGLPDDSHDYVTDEAKKLWKKFEPELVKLIKVLKNFNWGESKLD